MHHREDSYGKLEQKPYDSFYLLVEQLFDFPVGQVWEHALNIGSWMSAHRLETLDGEAGKVGHFERVYPRELSDEVAQPHYHLYGVAHVIPRKLIVLEVFPEMGGSYGKTRPRMSFDSLIFVDLGERTLLGFYMVDVHLGKGDEGFCRRRTEELAGVRTMLEGYFENLRQLIRRNS